MAHSCQVQYSVQHGDLSDAGEEITQGKTYSTTRRLDSLVILSEEDNLLEEFAKLSGDAEKILNDMFEVEDETPETNRETNTEEMMDEILGEVIDSIPEQNTEPSCSKSAGTKKVTL